MNASPMQVWLNRFREEQRQSVRSQQPIRPEPRTGPQVHPEDDETTRMAVRPIPADTRLPPTPVDNVDPVEFRSTVDYSAQPLDWSALVDPIKEAVMDGVSDLLEGAKEDVEEFALHIAKDTAKIVAIPDPTRRQYLLRSVFNQLRMLAELNRVRAINEAYETLERVVKVAASFAIKAIATGVIVV